MSLIFRWPDKCLSEFLEILTKLCPFFDSANIHSGSYFLPQYTVVDSVIFDIIANYDVCLFTLIVKIISIYM